MLTNKNIFEMDPLENPFVYMFMFSLIAIFGTMYAVNSYLSGIIITSATACGILTYIFLGYRK
jgi:hypothetical protein